VTVVALGIGAALYSCGSPTSSPSGDANVGGAARNSYYNHIWLEGPTGKTEFDENSFWGANEWEGLFHAFKKGDANYSFAFGPGYGQTRFERHLKSVGIPIGEHKSARDNTTIVDVTKIISIEGYEVSLIWGWRTDWK
ncbi:hypothetical protein, partial [Treponema endosymbiont of Eucomonympha sp.]|uniref:hypothetical protein n=1 Tax=Treponema endosymbiont of Eucomonympha sp. TaxID=1580831 RepID=UPI00164F6895